MNRNKRRRIRLLLLLLLTRSAAEITNSNDGTAWEITDKQLSKVLASPIMDVDSTSWTSAQTSVWEAVEAIAEEYLDSHDEARSEIDFPPEIELQSLSDDLASALTSAGI